MKRGRRRGGTIANRPTKAVDRFSLALRRQAEGRFSEAEPLYRQALVEHPGDARSLHMLGMIALHTGRSAEAYAMLSAALPALGDNADLHQHLGMALQGLGRLPEAADAYRAALRRRPCADNWNLLGLVLAEGGDCAEALACFVEAATLRPDSAEMQNNLGWMLERADRCAEAMTAFVRALQLRPDYTDARLNVAVMLRAAGRIDEARAAVEQALIAEPTHAYALYILSELKTFAPGDPDIARLEAAGAAAGHESKERADLAFALGKAKMDAGDADGAFASFHLANRIRRAGFDYAVDDDIRRMQRIAQTFDPAFMQRFRGGETASDLPVFILGMPRSGGTLVEQILASHPAVAGAGELPILPELIEGLHAAERAHEGDDAGFDDVLRDAGARCLQQIAPFGSGAQRVTNKAIGLFFHAGLLRLMLPGARFIHCRRDPVDTCFSGYTKNFVEPPPFAYDLAELGAFHRGYAALMAHWRAVLPPACFLEVDYEAVTDDLEREARRLIAFVGLDWDESCLSFHQTVRRVRTASCDEVRRPIYRSSVGRWRAYARHLAPLIAALGIE